MIYVVSHEIIPETHSRGFQQAATGGLIVGLALMMFMDVALG
jgi:ZIP family zinc transporter